MLLGIEVKNFSWETKVNVFLGAKVSVYKFFLGGQGKNESRNFSWKINVNFLTYKMACQIKVNLILTNKASLPWSYETFSKFILAL